MESRRSSIGVLLWAGLVGLAAACSSESSKAPATETRAEGVAYDAASTFDPATFCGEILPLAKVASLVGKTASPLRATSDPGREPAGMQLCAFEAGEGDPPEVRLQVMVDCRALRLDKAGLAAMAGELGGESGTFENVPLGGGGVRVQVPRIGTRFFGFVHDQVPCTVVVSVDFSETDPTQALAEHLRAKLSPANRPR